MRRLLRVMLLRTSDALSSRRRSARAPVRTPSPHRPWPGPGLACRRSSLAWHNRRGAARPGSRIAPISGSDRHPALELLAGALGMLRVRHLRSFLSSDLPPSFFLSGIVRPICSSSVAGSSSVCAMWAEPALSPASARVEGASLERSVPHRAVGGRPGRAGDVDVVVLV